MGNNGFTQTFADGSSLTAAELQTGYQSVKLDISNTDQMTVGSTTGTFLKSNGSGSPASFSTLPDPIGPSMIRNYGLMASATAGVLKVWLKDNNLSDPSTSSAVDIPFSTYGSVSATYTNIQVTSALSSTVVSSATLGVAGTAASPIYVYAVKNSTAAVLGFSARSDLDNGIPPTLIQMSVSADSQLAIYSTLTGGVYQVRLLGSVTAAHDTAGAWKTPTHVSISNNMNLSDNKTWEAITNSSPFSIAAADNIASRMDFQGANAIAETIGQPGANSIFNTYTRTLNNGTSTTGVRGVAISSSCGNFTSSSTSTTGVTNLVVSLTTNGRPVCVGLIGDGSNQSYIKSSDEHTLDANIYISNASTPVLKYYTGIGASGTGVVSAASLPPSAIQTIDTSVAGTPGTYTYSAFVNLFSSAKTINFQSVKLFAYEL